MSPEPQAANQQDLPLAGHDGGPVDGVFSVDRVTFLNSDNGYAVVRVLAADHPNALPTVAVGIIGEPREGECYRLRGTWRQDPRYGMQIRVESAVPETPDSLPAIERYLAGASIKGLGPYYAHRLVAHFGPDTFRVLQEGGQRLEEVEGIGPKRAALIRQSWTEHQGLHYVMVNLQGVAGLTPRQAQQVQMAYGPQAWSVVSGNPYKLAEDLRGFGFRRCDDIARELGLARDAPQRLQAGVLHLLREALGEGHVWTPRHDVVAGAVDLVGVGSDEIAAQVDCLVEERRVATWTKDDADAPFLAIPRVAATEEGLARRLAQWLRSPPAAPLGMPRDVAHRLVAQLKVEHLTAEQGSAIVNLLAGAKSVVLTGGPGTGKTTTVRTLLTALESLAVDYALCATTGRAAKQLAASTGRPASTVHRHLRIGGSGDRPEPVAETVLIIDEASMIDLWLMEAIAIRLTSDTHLVLVGDVDQLPSVGPGAVLQDVIAAEDAHTPGVSVTRLTRIFRQEAGEASSIVVNCHRVRRGERPVYEPGSETDYYEMMRETPEEARDLAVELAAMRLPSYLEVSPSEVQVLSPMHRGEAGIESLNRALQARLNPPDKGRGEITLPHGGRDEEIGHILREGDKVRQTQNNYSKRVFNGDLGIVTRIDRQARNVLVRMSEHTVEYAFEELDQLTHAWAMTVHAAQGSQWPAVVIVLLTAHYVMLERNILYTALSRAERLAVLVTQEKAVHIAVAQDRSTRRRTRLTELLAQGR